MRCLILFSVTLVCLLVWGVSAARAAAVDPIDGLWLTEDGAAVVRLYSCGGDVCGRFYWIAPGQGGPGQIDSNNHDPAKRLRPLCGMQFIGGFKKTDEGEYDGGWIYNPEDGEDYNAELTLEKDGTLSLRGYVLLPVFGQSQVWTRVDSHPSCKGPKP